MSIDAHMNPLLDAAKQALKEMEAWEEIYPPWFGEVDKQAVAALRQAIKDEEESFRPDYDTNAVLLERIRELEAQLEQAEKQERVPESWMGITDNPYCGDLDCNDPNGRAMRWHNKLLDLRKQAALEGLAETLREIEQEPVGEVLNIQWMSNTGGWLIGFHSKQRLYKGDKLYVEPMSTKQENIDTKPAHVDGVDIQPVAEVNLAKAGYINWLKLPPEGLHGGKLLYTAPPKREWKSLTDNEIIFIENSTPSRSYNDHARAIEAKLKELNT